MPTTEERREVAARLRNLAGHKAADEELTLDALGLYRGENIEGYDTYGVMQLADLIEPEQERTCALTHRSWDDGMCTWGVECSECGARFEHETGECWRYCPRCGAKVVS